MTAPDPRTKLEALQARILRRKREHDRVWWRRVWRWVRGES